MNSSNDPRLSIVSRVIERFKEHGVGYCHWKSNEHALAAVQGDTDLDMLFDENQEDLIDNLLEAEGFKKYKTAWFVKYPYIKDYLVIDKSEGKVVHIHAHFRLVLGEKRVKSHRLPWERNILDTRMFLSQERMHATRPDYELLLLIVRLTLKLPVIGGEFASEVDSQDAEREFLWLKERVSESELTDLSIKLLGESVKDDITRIYRQGLNKNNLTSFKRSAKDFLNNTRRMSRISSLLSGIVRWFFYNTSRVNRKLNRLSVLSNHRRLPQEGVIVAVMGADGSGKSTLTKSLTKELKKKMDTVFIYMGSGNGSMSWHRYIIKTVINIVAPKKTVDLSVTQRTSKSDKSFIYNAGKVIYAISLSLEKKQKLKLALKAKKKGVMVVCDRYPQNKVAGYNDGPLLEEYSSTKNYFLKRCVQFERDCYALSETISPDIVLKLIGDVSVLHKRREEEMNIQTIHKKQSSILELEYKNEMIIDATLPVKDVHKTAMIEIAKVMN